MIRKFKCEVTLDDNSVILKDTICVINNTKLDDEYRSGVAINVTTNCYSNDTQQKEEITLDVEASLLIGVDDSNDDYKF